MAGGAGYILSKESLTRYIEKGMNEGICNTKKGGNEDSDIGSCLRKLQVIAGDVRDEKLRERFFQFRIETALLPQSTDWWVKAYIWHKIHYGISTCCSDTLVTVHKITPEEMYLFEYFIYKIKVFGQHNVLSYEFPEKLTLNEVVKHVDGKNWVMNRWP